MALKKKASCSDLPRRLSDLRAQLTLAYGEFERESDFDLVAARIYDINSLSAQYSHCLGLARREDITAEPSPCGSTRYFPDEQSRKRAQR